MKSNVNILPGDEIGSSALAIMAKAGNFNKWMYDEIKNSIHGNILEVGSGLGNISAFFINDNCQISLSDADSYYLDILREKFARKGKTKPAYLIDLNAKNFKTIHQELCEKFDSVFLLNVLEHIENDKVAIENCKFLLKENGLLTVLVPAYKFLYSRMDKELGHYRRYTSKSLTKVFNENGLVVKKRYFFNAIGIAAWFYGKILKLKIVPAAEMSLFDKLTAIGRLIDKVTLKKIGLSIIIVGVKKDI